MNMFMVYAVAIRQYWESPWVVGICEEPFVCFQMGKQHIVWAVCVQHGIIEKLHSDAEERFM